MKAVLAFLAANGLFFTANAIAAGAFLGMAKLLPAGVHGEPWAWLLIGLLSIAAGVGFAVAAVRFISRSRG